MFYKWEPEFKITSRDKIGLFCEGWSSTADVYTSVCASCPGDECQRSVVFVKECLPPEEERFYQLCYISEDGTINGVSEAFQFMVPNVAQDLHQPREEDPSEVNDTQEEPLSTTKTENELRSLKQQLEKKELECEELTHQSRREKREHKAQLQRKARELDQMAQKHKAIVEENRKEKVRHAQLQKDYSELKMKCDRKIKDEEEDLAHRQETIQKLETQHKVKLERARKEAADERVKNTEVETQLQVEKDELHARIEKSRVKRKNQQQVIESLLNTQKSEDKKKSRLEHKLHKALEELAQLRKMLAREPTSQPPEIMQVGQELQGAVSEKATPKEENESQLAAYSGGPRSCPICNKQFPADIAQFKFEYHVHLHLTD